MGTRVMDDEIPRGQSSPNRRYYRQHDPSYYGSSADPLQQQQSRPTDPQQRRKKEQIDQLKNFVGLGIGLSSVFSEYVLSHPCVVLRRQCQVKSEGGWYHLTPFTIFPVVFNIGKHQGLTSLWKGIGSTFAARGIFLVSETIISEITPFPKEVTRHSSLKKIGQHFVLKCMAHTLTTPFYASSFVETVQSDIASERPGVFDCLKEGVTRVMGWGLPQSTRLLPVYKLILPVLGYKLSHYVISSIAQYTVMSAVKVEQRERQSSQEHLAEASRIPSRSMYDKYFPELLAAFTGNFLADVMLYPLETVMHRLFIQGTRTILDNMDSGLGVLPIHTRYEGPLDCFMCIIKDEGLTGLYKGFGALLLQYCIHATILRTVKFLFEQLSQDNNPPPIQQRRR
ncbi:mitochondrial outer membrane protein SLC25A46-like [Liolophura sinensis]|uniref:mitochondrial outer membrane protein SLC25A46-like n=1 Tax=Liolophura sinensis TaxID=3198878 RepID=UPI0031584437